jgi:hypothetical protein
MNHPFQHRRPRPNHLARAQMVAAVASEIRRLQNDFYAVEAAPTHECDKDLLHSACDGSRCSIPGPNLRFTTASVYQVERRLEGLAFRDFESPVFTVPKKNGRFRLSTNYRKLNMFQRKTTFQMDDTQLTVETIQRGGLRVVVGLKGRIPDLGPASFDGYSGGL